MTGVGDAHRSRDSSGFLHARGFDRPLSREEARALFKLTLPLGYPGTVVPASEGGAGLDHVALGITIEELVSALGFLGPHVATRQIAFISSDARSAASSWCRPRSPR